MTQKNYHSVLQMCTHHHDRLPVGLGAMWPLIWQAPSVRTLSLAAVVAYRLRRLSHPLRNLETRVITHAQQREECSREHTARQHPIMCCFK